MLRLSGLIEESIVDGPGIRTTIFSQGCPHKCIGCHNPETWSFEGGTLIEEEKIIEIIKVNPLIRGVTFSGGEPFSQAKPFSLLAQNLKREGYEIASYTGYTIEQLLSGTNEQKVLLENLDILIDGPFVLGLKTMNKIFRGSSNQRIIDVQESLIKGKVVEIREPRWTGEY